MVKHVFFEKEVPIPENVTVKVDGMTVHVKGPKGELTRTFDLSKCVIEMTNNNTLRIYKTFITRKKDAAAVGTIAGHIKNMFKGVTEGYKYTLVMASSHFPMTAKVDKAKSAVYIENFYGRKAPIIIPVNLKNIDIKIKGKEIEITGSDIEAVSQAAAKITEATRLRGRLAKDPTVFQDGIYLKAKS